MSGQAPASLEPASRQRPGRPLRMPAACVCLLRPPLHRRCRCQGASRPARGAHTPRTAASGPCGMPRRQRLETWQRSVPPAAPPPRHACARVPERVVPLLAQAAMLGRFATWPMPVVHALCRNSLTGFPLLRQARKLAHASTCTARGATSTAARRPGQGVASTRDSMPAATGADAPATDDARQRREVRGRCISSADRRSSSGSTGRSSPRSEVSP